MEEYSINLIWKVSYQSSYTNMHVKVSQEVF